MDLATPKVMGILNVTPDSFFASSRCESEEEIYRKARKLISEGADIIDIGGCSTRPGFDLPSVEEETERVNRGCRIVRELSSDIPISVDTFRASVAEMAIKEWNVSIINDVSGGVDKDIWPLAARFGVAYVLTHNPLCEVSYNDVTADVITWLAKKANEIHRLGVNDFIIDPGFGFYKSVDENFRLFEELNEFVATGWPVLIGISRKSMLYKTLDCSPEETLDTTVAMDAIALEKGVQILRVHDVKPAKNTIRIFSKLKAQ